MATVNGLVTNIPQNIFFCNQQPLFPFIQLSFLDELSLQECFVNLASGLQRIFHLQQRQNFSLLTVRDSGEVSYHSFFQQNFPNCLPLYLHICCPIYFFLLICQFQIFFSLKFCLKASSILKSCIHCYN